MTDILKPLSKTPEEWRELARKTYDKAGSSADNSISAGVLAEAYRECANLAENNGISEFRVVTDSGGRILDAKELKSHYGQKWIVYGENGNNEVIVEEEQAPGYSRTKKSGYKFITLYREAYVKLIPGEDNPASIEVIPADEFGVIND